VRIQFHRAASEELAEAASWYEAQQPGLGDDLLHEIDRALLTIDESPQAWPMLPHASCRGGASSLSTESILARG